MLIIIKIIYNNFIIILYYKNKDKEKCKSAFRIVEIFFLRDLNNKMFLTEYPKADPLRISKSTFIWIPFDGPRGDRNPLRQFGMLAANLSAVLTDIQEPEKSNQYK